MTDETPRTDALNAELYDDAMRRKVSRVPVQEPYERAIELCGGLERELAAARAKLAEKERECEALRNKSRNQRRELKRLNKVLSVYWPAFRRGLTMANECRLREIVNAAFGHEKVRAAEHAAIDAARGSDNA